MRDGVLAPPTVPGTSLTAYSRSGVTLEVVADKVGLPVAARPVGAALAGVLGGLLVLFLVTKDAPEGPDLGAWRLPLGIGVAAVCSLVWAGLVRAQVLLVREHSSRWRVAVVAPDVPRAPRGRWVLVSERLPRGVDPRERMDELVSDVRAGRLDARRTRWAVRPVVGPGAEPARGTATRRERPTA